MTEREGEVLRRKKRQVKIRVDEDLPLNPSKIMGIADDFLSHLMAYVPFDYEINVRIENHCPWLVSFAFPAEKSFRGKLPPMKEPES